jgi:hypothetical protein
VHFYQLGLRALERQRPDETATSIETVCDDWNAMSKAQQTHWEPFYLVIFAYAQAHVCLNQNMRNWSEQLNALKRRRGGKLPQRMTQIANRKGFSIAIEFGNRKAAQPLRKIRGQLLNQ